VLDTLERKHQIAFRYCDPAGNVDDAFNPNGSRRHIGGLLNEGGNVLGMMPHPERAVEGILGSTDGLLMFQSVAESLARRATDGVNARVS